jgi:hypothetical protein
VVEANIVSGRRSRSRNSKGAAYGGFRCSRDLGFRECSGRVGEDPRAAGAFVEGASGQVGGALVEELVRRDAQIRAMARTEERADGLAARGVDAVVADSECHYPALAPALRGVKNAFGPSWTRVGP